MISKFYSLIINRGDYCICLPTPLQRTKIVIYFCKQEDANANTQSPAGGCSISTFLRRGWDGASAGQRLTSQHDNAAVLNSTRWKKYLTPFLVGGLFLQAIFTLCKSIQLSWLTRDKHICENRKLSPINTVIFCIRSFVGSAVNKSGLQMHLWLWNNHLWMQHSGILKGLECKSMNYSCLTLWQLWSSHHLPTSSSVTLGLFLHRSFAHLRQHLIFARLFFLLQTTQKLQNKWCHWKKKRKEGYLGIIKSEKNSLSCNRSEFDDSLFVPLMR